jgi:hypothetical protein
MSWCAIVPSAVAREGWALGAREVVTWQEGLALLEQWLDTGCTLVGANTAFDALVAVYQHPVPRALLWKWKLAIEAGRVHDVLLRQPLLEGAFGVASHKHSLATTCKTLGTNTQPNKASPWRTAFWRLDGLPISSYPRDAYGYSLEDAICTAECWIKQDWINRNGSPYFPGLNPLLSEPHEVMGAFAINDLAGAGVRADAQDTEAFRQECIAERARAIPVLLAHGLMRREVKLAKAAVVALAKETQPLPLTPKGKPSVARKFLRAHPDPRIRACGDLPRSEKYLLQHGLATEFVRNDTLARQWITRAFLALGLPPLLKLEKNKKTGEERETVRVDNDACTQSKDPVMLAWTTYARYNKTLTTDFQWLSVAAKQPFHAYYSLIQSTGRTATGKDGDGEGGGNVQNPARAPGVRECVAPRPGNLLFDCDFSSVELHTFAQICYWILGWSQLGDDLNAGVDSHLKVAAAILRITYEEAKARKGEGIVKRARTGGKGVNFGRKGNMGPKKLVAYFWNNYRVKLGGDNATPAQSLKAAKDLIALHDALTPEFPLYSEWAQRFARHPGGNTFDLVHPFTARLRAGIGFNDVHNYPFQGLAVDLAKKALWRAFLARWGLSEQGEADPLYQALIILFVHDSVTGEAPAHRALAAGERLAQIMSDTAKEVLTNCPSKVEPSVGDRILSKQASGVYAKGPDGKPTGPLLPWMLREQCAVGVKKTVAEYQKEHPNTAWAEALGAVWADLRKDWPLFALREIVQG